jgi:hypothetical protein
VWRKVRLTENVGLNPADTTSSSYPLIGHFPSETNALSAGCLGRLSAEQDIALGGRRTEPGSQVHDTADRSLPRADAALQLCLGDPVILVAPYQRQGPDGARRAGPQSGTERPEREVAVRGLG